MRTVTCDICFAQVKPYNDYSEHRDWHARLHRAIYDMPEPPPARKPL